MSWTATAAETDRPNMSFGPDHEYDLREKQFTELLEDGKLIALRDLVTYSHMPDNQDDTIAAVYHQSYALVTWLSRQRRGEHRRARPQERAAGDGSTQTAKGEGDGRGEAEEGHQGIKASRHQGKSAVNGRRTLCSLLLPSMP